jgi:predicted unusual protein kinase regulating ubiquinone biosynthesis (AarF/ABC1/UbiB family)
MHKNNVKIIFYFLYQSFILFLFCFSLILNKILNGKISNYVKKLATLGGPFFIKSLQWITQKEELSYLLCVNSIKDLQYYCYLKDEEYAKKIIDKYYLNLELIEYLGSGSIAQVYKCEYNGKICAVKILHNNIIEILSANIIFGKIFFYVSQKYNLLPLLKSYDYKKIFSEHLRQCDLISEANNTKFLHDNNDIAEINYADIYFSNYDIIIEDYFDGYKYGDFIKIFPEHLKNAKILEMTAFMNMIFTLNIIHGDCHDGNILYNVIEDRVNIYLIDCGILHEIDEDFKDVLYKMFLGYNTRNADLQISLYEKYNFVENKEELKELLLVAMNENRRKNNFGLYIKRIMEINKKYKLCGHYLFDILCVNILLILGNQNSLLGETIKCVMKEKKYVKLYEKLNSYQFDLY